MLTSASDGAGHRPWPGSSASAASLVEPTIRGMATLRVDVYVDGRRTMVTDSYEGGLVERVRGTSTATRQAPRRTRDCVHENSADGFAYVEWRDEHWPIRYCLDCYLILAGRHPRIAGRPGQRRAMTEEDVVAAKWANQWPKGGKPRRRKAPPESEWPTGY
jgi:hypothetical protein